MLRCPETRGRGPAGRRRCLCGTGSIGSQGDGGKQGDINGAGAGAGAGGGGKGRLWVDGLSRGGRLPRKSLQTEETASPKAQSGSGDPTSPQGVTRGWQLCVSWRQRSGRAGGRGGPLLSRRLGFSDPAFHWKPFRFCVPCDTAGNHSHLQMGTLRLSERTGAASAQGCGRERPGRDSGGPASPPGSRLVAPSPRSHARLESSRGPLSGVPTLLGPHGCIPSTLLNPSPGLHRDNKKRLIPLQPSQCTAVAMGYICRGIPEGFGDPAQEAGHLLCRNRHTQSPGPSARAGAGWPGRPRQGQHLKGQPATGTGCRPQSPLPRWAPSARRDARGYNSRAPTGGAGKGCVRLTFTGEPKQEAKTAG